MSVFSICCRLVFSFGHVFYYYSDAPLEWFVDYNTFVLTLRLHMLNDVQIFICIMEMRMNWPRNRARYSDKSNQYTTDS
ncbi:hypothetical protein DL95DRAFT_396593, partial [Leptodontidium sp. 2 PMI_412]